MNLRSALLAASFMALPLAANAQAVNGPYIGLGAGVNFMQNEHAKVSVGTAETRTADAKVQLGPAVVGSIGWGFGNGLRAEVEANYRYNAFSDSDTTGVTRLGGNEQKFG